LRLAPVHLRSGEVLVSIVHGLELAAVDYDACFPKQIKSTAEQDEAGADGTGDDNV
jgi:hypothetical protein